MKFNIDFKNVKNKEDFYKLINENLDTYYEICNLDSLYDFLTESYGDEFVFLNCNKLFKLDNSYGIKIYRLFVDVEINTKNVFISLIDSTLDN